jgi:hypothetical protein
MKYRSRKRKSINKTKRKHKRKQHNKHPLELYSNYLHLGIKEEPNLIPIDFSVENQNQMDIKDLSAISRKILFDTIHNSTYSLLPYYFMNENIPIKHQDDYVSKYNSGNCVFFAKKVLHELKRNGIRGYLIPATTLPSLRQPGFPEFCHCVVLVKSENYFIIYEPAFYVLEPILVHIDGSPSAYSVDVYDNEWLYTYDRNTNRINVTDSNGNPLLYYSLMNVLNPTTAISYPVNIYNKRLPIVKYDAYNNRKQAHLSIRLDTKCLEGYHTQMDDQVGDKEEDGWFPRFPYSNLLNEPISDTEKKARIGEWVGLSNKNCQSLQCKKSDLVNKVFWIIKYHHK